MKIVVQLMIVIKWNLPLSIKCKHIDVSVYMTLCGQFLRCIHICTASVVNL